MNGFLERLNRVAPVRTWAMFLAGPPLLLFSVWIVWIIWKGPWPANQAARQLDILGKALWISLGLDGVIVVALAAARVHAQGIGGTSISIDSASADSAAPSPAVVTTTTTEVK